MVNILGGNHPWLSRYSTPSMLRMKLSYAVALLFAKSVAAQTSGSGNDRSLAAALQNINGTSSILSLIPVLTGKVQNVKMIAGRIFPGSLAIAGLGAGRVLSKLQMGVLLYSRDLYRNLVGDFSYHHQEYVNTFSPPLIHIPTGTPERHASNVIINHNATEDYMVEAWFQTRGEPARVELEQRNGRRIFVGMGIYTIIYAFETYLGVQNVATGMWRTLVGMQAVSGCCWLVAVWVLQMNRGQGNRFINLNRLNTPEYRCFQLQLLGHRVQSATMSTEMTNIQTFNFFGSKYENRTLQIVGALMIFSGVSDVFATVFIVGLNSWAYGWLGYQVALTFVKVVFSLEPLRQIPIRDISPMVSLASATPPTSRSRSHTAPLPDRTTKLPIVISSAPGYTFTEVCVGRNIVVENATSVKWQSRTPGVYIGQPYYPMSTQASGNGGTLPVRYLTLVEPNASSPESRKELALDPVQPRRESNGALQREYLDCLAAVVNANKVPSPRFVLAVELTVHGIRGTVNEDWFSFGTKDLMMYLKRCQDDIIWRRFV